MSENDPITELALPVDALRRQVDDVGRRELASLQRREGDRRLVEELAAEGFSGRRYAMFETELIRYGISVLDSWMITAYIFKLTREKMGSLKPTDAEIRELREDADLREHLAGATIAVTLPKFKNRALVAGGWTFEGGASLPTYFMGATLYTFPNEFRRYRHERTVRLKQDGAALAYYDHAHGVDPATHVTSRGVVHEALQRLQPRNRAVVELHLLGYSHAEIAEQTSAGSVRVVEGVLHRWREAEKRLREAGASSG